MTDPKEPFGINEENAFDFIVRYITENRSKDSVYGNQGCDLMIPNAMHNYVESATGSKSAEDRAPYFPGIAPSFYAAAWELCRRGILRPGASPFSHPILDGTGYSVTPSGWEWFKREG